MRIPFEEVFSNHAKGITPKVPVLIKSTAMAPGVPFGEAIDFGGVALASLAGKELDVEIRNGIYVVIGYVQ